MKIGKTWLIVLLLMPAMTQAAFEYRSGTPRIDTGAAESCTLSGLIQSGQGLATHTMSFGYAIPITTAARMIAPDGWRITASLSLASLRVTWQAGGIWTNTLVAVLADVAACATLDWTDKHIHLYVQGTGTQAIDAYAAKRNSSIKAEPLRNDTTMQVVNKAGLKTAKTGAEPAESTASTDTPTTTRWRAMAGTTIRQTLAAWAKMANWQRPIWDLGDDVLITASAGFTGTFEEAVTALIRNVGRGGTSIAVTLYRENKVIHISGGS